MTRHPRWANRLRNAAALTLSAWLIAGPLPVGPLLPGAVADQMLPMIAPDARSPLAEPVVDSDALLRGNKAQAFAFEDGARGLLLSGDVSAQVGVYGFRADRAVVRIDTQRLPGKVIRHLSVYFDNARPLRTGGRTHASAPRLLLTAATTGKVDLIASAMDDRGSAAAGDLVDDPFVAKAQDRFSNYFAAVAARTLDVPDSATPLYSEQALALKEARRATLAAQAQRTARRFDFGDAPGSTTTPGATQAEGFSPGSPGSPGSPALAPALQPEETPRVSTAAQPPSPRRDEMILPPGAVTFTAERIVLDRPRDEQGNASDEASVMLVGDVGVFYDDPDSKRTMSLQAQKAVIFLDAAKLGDLSPQGGVVGDLDASAVKGVYLEDNVIATDGSYTIRGPRVYYDPSANRAIVLDAVLYSWDVNKRVPLYLRAEQLRQQSRTSFAAWHPRLTTSEFGEPHFAVGASRVTIDQRPASQAQGFSPGSGPAGASRSEGASGGGGGGGGGGMTQTFTAHDATFQWRGLPIFYWPKLTAQTQDIPIRRIRVGYDSDTGPTLETRWDLFALAGKPRPDNVNLDLDVDYLGSHGPGLGLRLEYNLPTMFGTLDSYLLPLDSGDDTLGGRRDIAHSNETRGYFQLQHRQHLRDNWQLSLEAAYTSDETFLEELFPAKAATEKPYETSLYLKKQEDNWAFTFLAQWQLNDFLAQTTPLQNSGYQVAKAPELGFFASAINLFDNRLSYYTDTRAGVVRIRPDTSTPDDRGFRDSLSQRLFNIPAATSFEDRALAAGIPDDYRGRLDTRHEIQAPFTAGIFGLVPYAFVRGTAYDDGFEDFSGEDDPYRLLGGVGTRATTSFSRTYDGFSLPALDVHRLRHVLEPNLDLFLLGSTLENGSLPVFDPDVENITDGAGVRLGMRNTFQTQRGGEGRWRSVDWITLDTDFVFRENDTNSPLPATDPIARFFPYRPEFALGGDHFHSRLLWQVSDTFAFVGDMNYDLEDSDIDTYRTGVTFDHTPRLSWFLTYGEIRALDTQLLSYGFTYQLSTKYTLSVAQTIDFARNDSRSVDVGLERKLPRWRLRVFGAIDEVDDNQTIGIVLIPEGLAGNDDAPLSFGRLR